MSGNNDNEYDNQNDNQNYDEDQDQEQEYDSQDDNNGDNNGDDGDNNGDGNDGNNCDEDDDEDENPDGPKYIRLRGLPWSATHKEILDFLKGINVVGGTDGIHIATRRWDGVNSGEAYVELKGPQDAEAAMKLDNATMGHRYIEVFNASAREAKEAMRKTSTYGNSYVVKLRGLPFSITEQQVEEFFSGLEIKPDREGIVFVMDRRGRTTGQAFVQFESQEDTEQALGRNRQKIGHRYIEIFRSSLPELKRTTSGNGRMAPYDLKDRGGNRGGNNNDFGGNNRNNRWGGNGGFGVGANNTLGFSNLPNFGNSGNFGNNNGRNFGNFGNNGGGGGMGNFGNFGNNNGGENFGNFGNNNGGGNFGNNPGGGGNMSGGGGFNRFSGNSGNFGNDFGDFGNFGNNRGGSNNMGGAGGGNNMGGGGGFNNFSNNFGNGGGNNMGGGGGFGNNMGGGPNNGGGGNFGPIGGGRNDDLYLIMLRGLPFSSFENDVYKFFEPLRPVNVRIHYNKQNGRHNGTAEALFENYEDAQLAMKRHRCKMGARYIELLFNGKAKSGKGGGGNNYSTGGGNMSGGGGGIRSGNNGIGVGGGMGGGNAFSRRI